MEQCAAENLGPSNDSTTLDKKKINQNQQGVKKRRKVDSGCKSDQDAANYLAETYFNHVKNSLSYEGFEKFIKILCEYDTSIERDEVGLYHSVRRLLETEGQPELINEFLCFIRPQFTKQLAKYEDGNFLRKAWTIFSVIDRHHFSRMLNVLESLTSNPNVKITDIESSLRPLFKGQSNVVQAICQLFGSAKAHSRDSSEYENVLDIASDKDSEFEHVRIPRGQTDRSCPGQSACQCPCHLSSVKPLCSACNVRFINGRIYIQRGKEIRSARVNFSYGVSTEEMQRKLHPSYYAQQQALIESQPKNSPSKGEKKDRKNSQSDSNNCRSDTKLQSDSKVDCSPDPGANKSDMKVTQKSDKMGKSVAATSNSGVLSPLVHQVFYEENSQGFLEFFKRGSDDEADGEDLDVSISDSELTDPQPATSSDEHSSPTHRSPGRGSGHQFRGFGVYRKKHLSSKRLKK